MPYRTTIKRGPDEGMRMVGCYVADSKADEIAARARKLGMTKSELLRRLIDSGLGSDLTK